MAGHRVTRTSRTGGGTELECDLLDPPAIEAVLTREVPDAVVMAAGMSSVRSAWDDPPAAFAANTQGVFNLLEALSRSAPAAHLTMLSSASVYGSPASLPVTEDSPTEPSSPYGASKLAAERCSRQYARRPGAGVAVLGLLNQSVP